MGNEQTPSNQQKVTEVNNRLVLQLRVRDIILHYAFKMKASIGDIGVFPHGMSGLKLWDTNIILARYIILNSQRFRDKAVLDVNAGVGLSGVALKKWTTAKVIALTQYRDELVTNMKKNCQRNQADTGLVFFRLDWQQFQKFTHTYDIILSSDILKMNYSYKLLVQVFKKFLHRGGSAIMVMPERKQELKQFLLLINSEDFNTKIDLLTDEVYDASPLFNKVQGYEEFPRINKVSFYAVTLTKLKDQVIRNQQTSHHSTLLNQPKQINLTQPKPQMHQPKLTPNIISRAFENVKKEQNIEQENKKLEAQKVAQKPVVVEVEKKQQLERRIEEAHPQNVFEKKAEAISEEKAQVISAEKVDEKKVLRVEQIKETIISEPAGHVLQIVSKYETIIQEKKEEEHQEHLHEKNSLKNEQNVSQIVKEEVVDEIEIDNENKNQNEEKTEVSGNGENDESKEVEKEEGEKVGENDGESKQNKKSKKSKKNKK